MKVIGYIRVSPDEQANQGHSLAPQEAKLQAYAESMSSPSTSFILYTLPKLRAGGPESRERHNQLWDEVVAFSRSLRSADLTCDETRTIALENASRAKRQVNALLRQRPNWYGAPGRREESGCDLVTALTATLRPGTASNWHPSEDCPEREARL